MRWQQISCGKTYTITSTAVGNGTINPSGEITVVEFSNQTFTFEAEEGYKIDSLLIDGVNQPDSVAEGSYTFTYIDDDHTIHVVFVKEVGLNEPVMEINIYPNPTTGQLTIDNGQLTINNVEVFDVYGRKVPYQQLSIINYQLSIENLPAGIYFIHFQTEQGVVTKKFVKH